MKEIHAYLNEDGTYRVEIIGEVKHNIVATDGYYSKETIESKTIVPRAKIQIDALIDHDSGEIFSIELNEEN